MNTKAKNQENSGFSSLLVFLSPLLVVTHDCYKEKETQAKDTFRPLVFKWGMPLGMDHNIPFTPISLFGLDQWAMKTKIFVGL